jgi:hypothetical protein
VEQFEARKWQGALQADLVDATCSLEVKFALISGYLCVGRNLAYAFAYAKLHGEPERAGDTKRESSLDSGCLLLVGKGVWEVVSDGISQT